MRVNGVRAKPHRALEVGDRVEIELGDWSRMLVVVELHDRPLPKQEVPRIFVDESLPRPKLDAIDRALRGPAVAREAGAGRPTKKDRRDLDRLRRG